MSGASAASPEQPARVVLIEKILKPGSFLLLLLLAYRPPCLAAVTDASRQPRGNEESRTPLREESNERIQSS